MSDVFLLLILMHLFVQSGAGRASSALCTSHRVHARHPARALGSPAARRRGLLCGERRHVGGLPLHPPLGAAPLRRLSRLTTVHI